MVLEVDLPYTTGDITPPWADFSMVDISTVGTVPVPKTSALETSRRELSEDVSIVRYGHPLGCRAIELGKLPQGGAIHRGMRYSTRG